MKFPDSAFDIVCFDFDGILAVNTWPLPDIGDPIPEGVAMLTHYYDEGYAIKIHTARPPGHVPAITAWLQLHGLAHMVYEVIGGKPVAGLYIDDRAFRPAWVAEKPEREIVEMHEAVEETAPKTWEALG